MLKRVVGWLPDHRWPWVPVALATILTLPALWTGIQSDDYWHRAHLLGVSPIGTQEPLLDLFRFVPGTTEGNARLLERGFLPWWAHPDLRLAFLRPLSALTHILDYWLWPDAFVLQHAHSVVWFLLAVLAVACLFRQVHGRVAVAGLAALLFAVEDAHAMPAAWLANRSSSLTLLFGVVALSCHLRWRREGLRAYRSLGLACFGLGLLAGESALGIAAYFVAWEVCLGSGRLGHRLAALLPYGFLTLLWRGLYHALGFGATGSGIYLDPARDPLEFARAVAERGPFLLLGQWSQLPLDTWALLPPNLQVVLAGAGVAALVGLAALLGGLLRCQAEARFWGLGMLLSTVPLCAAFVGDRLLIFCGIGAFGLLALQADRLRFLAAEHRPAASPYRLSLWATGALLAMHLPLAALLLPARILAFAKIADSIDGAFGGLPDDHQVPGQSFIFVNGHHPTTVGALAVRQVEGGSLPRRISVLASNASALSLSRPDARTLRIRADDGFLPVSHDHLNRTLALPFRTGQRLATPDFVAEILDVTRTGAPATVDFHFRHRLESPQYRWFYYRAANHPQAFPLPSPGSLVTLPNGSRIAF